MLCLPSVETRGTARKIGTALGAAVTLVAAAIIAISLEPRIQVKAQEPTDLAPTEINVADTAPTPVASVAPLGAHRPLRRAEEPYVPPVEPEPIPDWRLLSESEQRPVRITRGFRRHRVLHFTFDDGPDLLNTPRLLDALSEYNVRATFFVVGRQLMGPRGQERRALLQQMEAEGHTVAVHTHAHRNLATLTPAQINEDLERVEGTLEATLGARPGLFRPPYGGRNARSNAVVWERGYSQILWNITPEGGGARTAEDMLGVFSRTLDRLERHRRGPGGIVLQHDPNDESVEAFTLMMEELRRRNCELLTTGDEELWDVVDDLSFYVLHEDEIPADLLARRQRDVREQAVGYCAARGS